MAELHAVTRDREAWSEAKPQAMDYLRHASRRSGRSAVELVREYAGLHYGRGKLTLPEYVQYRVYETDRSGEDKARFITNTLHWPITSTVCDMTWQAATEDKWLCAETLARSDIPTPEILAVIDHTDRVYPGARKIATVDELRAFAASADATPFFGKENRGICSFGAFLVTEADQSRLHLKGEGWLDYETCFSKFVGDTPYLLQRLQRNHAFFDAYTDSLATIRLCILMTDDGVKTPFAVLKLPGKENLADSFWRPGNIACGLDPETGKILTVRSKDALGTTDHDAHPETGAPLLGESVPMWEAVLDLARRCAPIFQAVRYQSMDIAVTPEGPMLIEINTGGGFDLPQLASGQGFLTDEVREFFHAYGYRKV